MLTLIKTFLRQQFSLIAVAWFLLFIAFTAFQACSDPTSPSGAAPNHTVNVKGVYHKTGLTNPTANCVECHGADLQGGTAKKSCFSCHGKKW